MATREEAIDILERGHAAIRRLLKQVPPHWMARPGVGGGTWTPKDLLGHLCLWEEKVLEALAAWDAGERAPIDREIYDRFDRGDQRGGCPRAITTHARSGAPRLGQRARGADPRHQDDARGAMGEPRDTTGSEGARAQDRSAPRRPRSLRACGSAREGSGGVRRGDPRSGTVGRLAVATRARSPVCRTAAAASGGRGSLRTHGCSRHSRCCRSTRGCSCRGSRAGSRPTSRRAGEAGSR